MEKDTSSLGGARMENAPMISAHMMQEVHSLLPTRCVALALVVAFSSRPGNSEPDACAAGRSLPRVHKRPCGRSEHGPMATRTTEASVASLASSQP